MQIVHALLLSFCFRPRYTIPHRSVSNYFGGFRALATGGIDLPVSAWKRMGSPQTPTAEQYAQLEKAGQLAALAEKQPVPISDNSAQLRLDLPRQAVSLIVLDWAQR